MGYLQKIGGGILRRGYIKYWRKSIDSEHQDDLITKVIWIELLTRVTHQEWEYQGAVIPRGGLITTYKELGEFAGGFGRGNKTVTLEQAKRSVKKLLNSGQVTTRKLRNKLLIQVVNYNIYQGEEKRGNIVSHLSETSQKHNENLSDTSPIEQAHKNIRIKEDVLTIVEYLNTRTGKSFKPNTKVTMESISARLKEGFTVADFKKVIDNKTLDWLHDPAMQEYLRPQTLFSSKFEGYLNSNPKGGNRNATNNWENNGNNASRSTTSSCPKLGNVAGGTG